MRLYSFNNNLLTQRMVRHDFAFMNLRFTVLAVMVSSAAYLSPAAYAADPIAIVPATNTMDVLTKPKETVKNDIELVSRPLIAGLWGMRIPNVSCIEYYNFKEDGQFIVKSSGEWSLGKYVYQLPDMEAMSKSLPQLSMGILYDSNAVDCSGNQVNQTGEVQQEFVKWISPTHIQFCPNPDGKQCLLNLHKVLP